MMRRAIVLRRVSRCRHFASVPKVPAGSPEAWREDKDKYKDLHNLPGGRQPPKDLRMGPYASNMIKDPVTGKVYPDGGKFFASPREDPVSFVVNCLIALTTVWTISQLSWGESFFEKRKRVIRERIRLEYGLPKGWEHEIDDEGELPLSEEAPSGTPAAEPASH
ncbi:unnamed protein product [Effrenium voratum]|nr:unnamed protein product [Effrenium voratum]CAJ1382904.1 unnamed protein product [Effrenium voratum]CAJ1436250.1 unnamed protein product [Effrenium voratum]